MTAEFCVWTREGGEGGLAIAIEGPSKAEITFEDREDGSCGISYVVSKPGSNLINELMKNILFFLIIFFVFCSFFSFEKKIHPKKPFNCLGSLKTLIFYIILIKYVGFST